MFDIFTSKTTKELKVVEDTVNTLSKQVAELTRLTTTMNDAISANALVLRSVVESIPQYVTAEQVNIYVTEQCNLLERNIRELEVLREQLDSVEQAVAVIGTIDTFVEEKVAERQKTIEQQREERLNGDTPYFDIVSEVEVDDDRVKYEMDYNPAFVRRLRKLGISGKTEEEIVLKYIKTIAVQIEENLPE